MEFIFPRNFINVLFR